MGIYSDGNVYGILIELNGKKMFLKTSLVKFTEDELREAKSVYEALTAEEKQKASISFYISCSSTYDSPNAESFMAWFPSSNDILEKLLATSSLL